MGDQADRPPGVSTPALILVRHGRPQVDPNIPPPEWGLSTEGRAAVGELAVKLSHLRPVAAVASHEPKAVETAELLAAPVGLIVERDKAFDEHLRPAWPFSSDPASFAARVEQVLTTPAISIDSAETGQAAAERFAAGLARRTERPLLVVSHGTVLSLYLAEHAGFDAVALWRSFGFPDALVLDAQDRLIARIS
ncbi:MAG TPA: histidine phosphatase family protein [Phenylobacterium sp.]|jgi:broad specificity phosphatase PhoE